MIKIIIKDKGKTGWVELPLTKEALNSIQPEQFLNKKEMLKFACSEFELNYKMAWRYINNCPEFEIYEENLNRNLIFVTRWIRDSFGLLINQNPQNDAKGIMRHIWYKIHAKSVPSKFIRGSETLVII